MTMEGTLSKWTNVMKGWQYRWFVLDDHAGIFSYYTSKEKMQKGVRRGCVRLLGSVIGIEDENDATFTITVDGKTFHFQAQDAVERARWISALEKSAGRHNCRPGFGFDDAKSYFAGYTYDTLGGEIEDFDAKLAESDAYLQFMLSKISDISLRMNDATKDKNHVQFDKFNEVVKRGTKMSESMKHSIVMLQIAKNAFISSEDISLPENTFVKSNDELSSSTSHIKSRNLTEDSLEVSDDRLKGPVDDVSIPGCSSDIPATEFMYSNQTATRNLNSSMVVPVISYSSSEEDDDFFDAEDRIIDDVRLRSSSSMPSSETVLDNLSAGRQEASSPLIDYDKIYEEDAEDSGDKDIDMKSHRSVITHLISQFRIGMDLTKIILPTFLLERRSLLEMYSDFFAHPDLFVLIPTLSSPEARMIGVLRWYLSSFHAARKSSIAKKPYNPILGEIFKCRWDWKPQTSTVGQGVNQESTLEFVSEQVSHHPPISAFYAIDSKKTISANAHIYTKSKFLGMSVAVYNIGQGCVRLFEHNEDYIITFPSGYGRSILTIPWVELGGKVSVSCPSTGFVSNIEFKCKQFFSSDIHKVAAEVVSTQTKKTVLKVEGEWNGRMMAKWPSGLSEVFVDVQKLPIIRKRVRKTNQCEPNESRRLWKDVTYYLKIGDIEAASEVKFRIEQRQRQDAIDREEKNLSWENKLFHSFESGDGKISWAYNFAL